MQSRTKLVKAVRARLLEDGPARASFREMAECAGVSVPTLRHYFRDRPTMVRAVLDDLLEDGRVHLKAASSSELPFAESMRAAADALLASVRFGGMDRVHALGLREGLDDGALGPGYLHTILEPSLQAIESRLEVHRSRREFKGESARYAAIAFVAPLLIAILHQSKLGGDRVRPMSLDEFAAQHVRAFVSLYGWRKRKKKPLG